MDPLSFEKTGEPGMKPADKFALGSMIILAITAIIPIQKLWDTYVFKSREKVLQKKLDEEREAFRNKLDAEREKHEEEMKKQKEEFNAEREKQKEEMKKQKEEFGAEREILRNKFDEEREKQRDERNKSDKDAKRLLYHIMEDHRGRDRVARTREENAWARECRLVRELDDLKIQLRGRKRRASF